MNKKIYFTLLPPFLILTTILAFTLPSEKRFYAFLAVFAFWITYYACNYFMRKRRDE